MALCTVCNTIYADTWWGPLNLTKKINTNEWVLLSNPNNPCIYHGTSTLAAHQLANVNDLGLAQLVATGPVAAVGAILLHLGQCLPNVG